MTSKSNQKQHCFLDGEGMLHSENRCLAVPLQLCLMLLICAATVPMAAQSNHTAMLVDSGTWHLHSRIPLGSDALQLRPSHQTVHLLASAEAPEFEGWSLTQREKRIVLLDRSGKPVSTLPKSITFRITVGTRDKFADVEPLPLETSKGLNDFLLDLHFSVQVFHGMEMHELKPLKTWMIGVPADEESDERIYRSTFALEDLRPEDRIVLLITDGTGTRLSKFHLEFL